ncbi:MAG: hypothetical protein JO045_04640 [Mycobacterium sp.]|nr:hypothetical protein [Mycobacterium sp.]
MNARDVNRKLAEEIEPRRYQTNVNLGQPPIKAAQRPVREYVTNVNWQARKPSATAARRTPAA